MAEVLGSSPSPSTRKSNPETAITSGFGDFFVPKINIRTIKKTGLDIAFFE